MKYYPFPQNRRARILQGLFLFAILYLVRDTLVTSTLLGFYRAQLSMAVLAAVAVCVFLLYNRRQWHEILRDGRMKTVPIITAVMLLPMILKRDWQIMYLSVLFCLYMGVFLSYIMTLEQAAKYYVVSMAVLGVSSVLATYVLRFFPDKGIVPVPVFPNPIDYDFYYFGLSFVSVSYVKIRNFGIFREPGVYQFFLILGLYLNHYRVHWKKDWQLWTVTAILAVTMLTTFATGGVFEMGLLAVVVFFDKKLYKTKWIRRTVVTFVGVLLLTLAVSAVRKDALYQEIYHMVFDKFASKGLSYTDRVGSIAYDLKLFFQSPLLGMPIAKVFEVTETLLNNTFSTGIMLAIFGIMGGILHILGWIALVWKREEAVWVKLALLLILFLAFNTQNLIADVFFWLFPMMALLEQGHDILKSRNPSDKK